MLEHALCRRKSKTDCFFLSKTLGYYKYNKWIYYSNFRVCVHTYVCQIYIPLGSTNCKPGYIK